jgi:hypothetical protein
MLKIEKNLTHLIGIFSVFNEDTICEELNLSLSNLEILIIEIMIKHNYYGKSIDITFFEDLFNGDFSLNDLILATEKLNKLGLIFLTKNSDILPTPTFIKHIESMSNNFCLNQQKKRLEIAEKLNMEGFHKLDLNQKFKFYASIESDLICFLNLITLEIYYNYCLEKNIGICNIGITSDEYTIEYANPEDVIINFNNIIRNSQIVYDELYFSIFQYEEREPIIIWDVYSECKWQPEFISYQLKVLETAAGIQQKNK